MTIELAELEHPVTSAPPPEERTNRLRWIVLTVTLVVWVVVGSILQGTATQELPVSTLTDFPQVSVAAEHRYTWILPGLRPSAGATRKRS